jgi:hypothetical protein
VAILLPPESLRDREAEDAHLLKGLKNLVRYEPLLRVDPLCQRRDDAIAKGSKRLSDLFVFLLEQGTPRAAPCLPDRIRDLRHVRTRQLAGAEGLHIVLIQGACQVLPGQSEVLRPEGHPVAEILEPLCDEEGREPLLETQPASVPAVSVTNLTGVIENRTAGFLFRRTQGDVVADRLKAVHCIRGNPSVPDGPIVKGLQGLVHQPASRVEGALRLAQQVMGCGFSFGHTLSVN